MWYILRVAATLSKFKHFSKLPIIFTITNYIFPCKHIAYTQKRRRQPQQRQQQPTSETCYFVQAYNMEKHEEQNMAEKPKKLQTRAPLNGPQKCGFPFLVHEDGGSPTPKRCANSRNWQRTKKILPQRAPFVLQCNGKRIRCDGGRGKNI